MPGWGPAARGPGLERTLKVLLDLFVVKFLGGHLTKPIKKPVLLRALAGFPAAAPASGDAPRPDAPDGDDGPIEVVVDADLEELIPEYLEMTGKDIETLREALGRKDLETLRVVGHTLKGSGSGYGFDRVTEIGGRIETLAKASSLDEISGLVKDLASYFKRVRITYS